MADCAVISEREAYRVRISVQSLVYGEVWEYGEAVERRWYVIAARNVATVSPPAMLRRRVILVRKLEL